MKAGVRTIAIISPYARSIVSFRGVLIRELHQRGVRVYVFAPDYTPEIRSSVQEIGAQPVDYPLVRTSMNPMRDGHTFLCLVRILRRLRPDVVMPYNIKPVVYGTLAAYLARVPRRVALIEGLGYAFIEVSSLRHAALRWVVQQLYRTALRYAHTAVFLNPDDQREFVQGHLVAPEKTYLLGGIGVDLCEWLPAPPVLEPITFTLAARLLREKGILEFAQAARVVKRRYPNTRFLLLGGTDSNPGALAEAEVQAWVEEGILEWLGHVPDVRPYFAQTSVYVLPSYREGVPRSTQEAMAMARPVITTDAPGCRETVVHGVNGFLVPPRDVEALVQAMERFIQQPELIITMGEASRKLAEEKFDAHTINSRLIRILEGTLNGGG